MEGSPMNSGIVPENKGAEQVSAKENLKTLAESNILADFVKEHDGEWDHQAWLDLCDEITEKGYVPIEFDQVGMLLETQRNAYFDAIKQ